MYILVCKKQGGVNYSAFLMPSSSHEALLYVSTCWKKAIRNLGYARHWSVAKEVTFELPVTPDGSIDFDYMERYIRALEKLTIANVVKEKDRIIAATRHIIDTH